jgi:uncharacterized membrane protein (UPF0127 family)
VESNVRVAKFHLPQRRFVPFVGRKFVPAAFLSLTASFLWVLAFSSAYAQGVEPLEISTATAKYTFSVEIAKDDAAREIGLMNRRFMPPDRGMLFEFDQVEPVVFWMKNTYISLDIIFIAKDGTVLRIAANAEPLSQALIPSGGPCLAVLELNGGAAALIGLAPGDKVRHKFFLP